MSKKRQLRHNTCLLFHKLKTPMILDKHLRQETILPASGKHSLQCLQSIVNTGLKALLTYIIYWVGLLIPLDRILMHNKLLLDYFAMITFVTLVHIVDSRFDSCHCHF